MARKKKKDEVENYFNNVANYQTEAEARAVTPEGVKVFCAFDELVPIGKVVWEKVKSGEYSMFSIGGTAIREEIEDDGAAAE